MPNIFKAFTKAKAEPYRFPDAAELKVNDPAPLEEFEDPAEGQPPPEEGEGFDARIADEEPEEAPAPEPEETPISFAKIQAEQIRADARREADELLAQAREAADRERAAVFAQARDEGHAEGYAAGMAQAAEQAAAEREDIFAAFAARLDISSTSAARPDQSTASTTRQDPRATSAAWRDFYAATAVRWDMSAALAG